jgi:hypothetical protein
MSVRHERRRRVLADESLAGDADSEQDPRLRVAAEPAGDAGAVPVAYAVAAGFDRQRRVHELFPTRYLAIALVTIGGLAGVGLIGLLHVWSASPPGLLEPEDMLGVSLTGVRNISHWFASTLMVVASLSAVFIYSMRRHRVDDYHGRYRVWIWTAIGCLLASLAETADVGHLARALCRRLAELVSISDAILWTATACTLLGAAGVRVFFEVRRCRLAAATWMLAALAFAAAVCVDRGWPLVISQVDKPLVERGLGLVGYVLVLATFLLYARHVLLEIEGLITMAPKRPKRVKAKTASQSDREQPTSGVPARPAPQLRTDLDPVEKTASPHAATRLQISTASARPIAVQATGSRSAAEQQAAHQALSRSERRRLRREAKMAS